MLKKVLPRLSFGGWADMLLVPEGSDETGFRTTLVLSKSGIDLTSPLGLGTLLAELGLFSESKAKTFSEKSFHRRSTMYREAAKMLVTGHCASDKDEEDFRIYSLLSEPFSERCRLAPEFGYSRIIRVILSALEKRFNADQFASLSRTQKEFYQRITATFRKELFREIQLTGDNEVDAIHLLNCF